MMTADTTPDHRLDADELDPNALAAIRALLATQAPQPRPDPTRVHHEAPQVVMQTAAPQIDAPQIDGAQVQAAIAASQPGAQDPGRKWGLNRSARPAKLNVPRPARTPGVADQIKVGIMAYRPTPKHIAIAVAVLLVLFRPWLVLGLLLLLIFVITGVFVILGYDGFWRQVMRLARGCARRHPSRSDEIHRKLDSFAMRFDGFLDRFPEGTVDGLYLPDLGDLAAAQARHDEALDRRFDKLRQSGA